MGTSYSYVTDLGTLPSESIPSIIRLSLSESEVTQTINQMAWHRQRIQANDGPPTVVEALRSIRAGRRITRDNVFDLASASIFDLIGLAWIIHDENRHGKPSRHLCTGSYGLSGGCPQGCSMCSFSLRRHNGSPLISQPDFKTTPDEFVQEARRQVSLARKHDPTAQIAFKVTHIGLGLRGNSKLRTLYVEILKAVRGVEGITFVDACLGLLDEESAGAVAPYVDKYNNNLERIQRPDQQWVTDKHSLLDKIETLRLAKGAGMGVCSGVLFGAGESVEDKVDILLLVRNLADEGVIDSSPVNAFVPIYEDDLAIIRNVPEDDLIRGLCLARIIMPSHRLFPNAGRFRYGRFLPAMHALADGYSSHHNYLTKFVDPATDTLIREKLDARENVPSEVPQCQ